MVVWYYRNGVRSQDRIRHSNHQLSRHEQSRSVPREGFGLRYHGIVFSSSPIPVAVNWPKFVRREIGFWRRRNDLCCLPFWTRSVVDSLWKKLMMICPCCFYLSHWVTKCEERWVGWSQWMWRSILDSWDWCCCIRHRDDWEAGWIDLAEETVTSISWCCFRRLVEMRLFLMMLSSDVWRCCCTGWIYGLDLPSVRVA